MLQLIFFVSITVGVSTGMIHSLKNQKTCSSQPLCKKEIRNNIVSNEQKHYAQKSFLLLETATAIPPFLKKRIMIMLKEESIFLFNLVGWSQLCQTQKLKYGPWGLSSSFSQHKSWLCCVSCFFIKAVFGFYLLSMHNA